MVQAASIPAFWAFPVLSLEWKGPGRLMATPSDTYRVASSLNSAVPCSFLKSNQDIEITYILFFNIIFWKKKGGGSLVGSLWKPLTQVCKLGLVRMCCQLSFLLRTWNASTRQDCSKPSLSTRGFPVIILCVKVVLEEAFPLIEFFWQNYPLVVSLKFNNQYGPGQLW